MTLYDVLQKIQPNQFVEYGIILVFVMFLVTRVIQPSALQLIGLIIGLIVIYYRHDKDTLIINDTYGELYYRMKTLYPKPANFHMDADLINLYFNIREFRKYHSEGYDESLVAVDNMLKIISEIEADVTYHCKENIDIIRDFYNKALNHMHSVIYKIPPTSLEYHRKHKRAINALQIILRRHIDDVVQRCKKLYNDRGIDINWHDIQNDGPRPDDSQKAERSDFDFYY